VATFELEVGTIILKFAWLLYTGIHLEEYQTLQYPSNAVNEKMNNGRICFACLHDTFFKSIVLLPSSVKFQLLKFRHGTTDSPALKFSRRCCRYGYSVGGATVYMWLADIQLTTSQQFQTLLTRYSSIKSSDWLWLTCTPMSPISLLAVEDSVCIEFLLETNRDWKIGSQNLLILWIMVCGKKIHHIFNSKEIMGVMGPKNKGSITRRADFGRTPISDIFRGQLRSRVQRAGDQSTDNVQPFFTLQLDIEKAQSVKEALDNLVGRDQLEGVTCSRTNQEVEAWQQVNLEELPLVLLLHLKWFDYKMDGASKIVKFVEFPIDLKMDQKLMSSTKKYGPKQRQYKLFAVVYHDGKEATKGHYVTDVYHVGYGGWVRYDDSLVKAVQESNVLRPRGPRVPYLLFYRRCDTIGSSQPSSAPDKTR
ncbi:hypothetical protein L9F63_024808, partial [Diploptera punctata]